MFNAIFLTQLGIAVMIVSFLWKSNTFLNACIKAYFTINWLYIALVVLNFFADNYLFTK